MRGGIKLSRDCLEVIENVHRNIILRQPAHPVIGTIFIGGGIFGLYISIDGWDGQVVAALIVAALGSLNCALGVSALIASTISVTATGIEVRRELLGMRFTTRYRLDDVEQISAQPYLFRFSSRFECLRLKLSSGKQKNLTWAEYLNLSDQAAMLNHAVHVFRKHMPKHPHDSMGK